MKKFKVYFRQVNWTCYEVTARGATSAVNKAEKLWREEYKLPTVEAVEVQKDD